MRLRLLFVSLFALSTSCGGSGISIAAPTISRVVITPAGSVALAPGGRQQFSVAATDAGGLVITPVPAVTWRATGLAATVDALGVATANALGTSYIKASIDVNGHVISDSVKVTVAAAGGT